MRLRKAVLTRRSAVARPSAPRWWRLASLENSGLSQEVCDGCSDDTYVRDDVPVTEPVASAHTEAVRHDEVVERRAWSPTFGPAIVLGALGAIGVIVSLFTSWRDPGVHPDNIPVAFLWHNTTTSHDPSLLIVLIPIAVMLAVGAFVPMGTGLRLLGGVAMLIVAGLFAYQIDQSLPGGGDVLGTGFYVGAIGGFLAFISGFLPESWAARREVVRSSVVDDRAASEPTQHPRRYGRRR